MKDQKVGPQSAGTGKLGGGVVGKKTKAREDIPVGVIGGECFPKRKGQNTTGGRREKKKNKGGGKKGERRVSKGAGGGKGDCKTLNMPNRQGQVKGKGGESGKGNLPVGAGFGRRHDR